MMRLAVGTRCEYGSDGLQGNTDNGFGVWMIRDMPQIECNLPVSAALNGLERFPLEALLS